MFFLATDEDLLRQVAAVHHLKNAARRNLRAVGAIWFVSCVDLIDVRYFSTNLFVGYLWLFGSSDIASFFSFFCHNQFEQITVNPRFDGDEDYKTRDKFAAFPQIKASSANKTTSKSCWQNCSCRNVVTKLSLTILSQLHIRMGLQTMAEPHLHVFSG